MINYLGGFCGMFPWQIAVTVSVTGEPTHSLYVYPIEPSKTPCVLVETPQLTAFRNLLILITPPRDPLTRRASLTSCGDVAIRVTANVHLLSHPCGGASDVTFVDDSTVARHLVKIMKSVSPRFCIKPTWTFCSRQLGHSETQTRKGHHNEPLFNGFCGPIKHSSITEVACEFPSTDERLF